ncbi:MAG: hypothetical protein K2P78_08535 [Gemmataceae bacterium]|nr:hypothetical protein [Gemmataceae bacterium]
MPYNTFTLDRVRADFGLTVETHSNLFGDVPPVQPDAVVTTLLGRYRNLAVAIGTEKAKSEMLIAPLLGEAWRVGGDRVAMWSGVAFNVDPAADLTGVCDFIVGYPPQLDYVTTPVLMVTEAKNENIMGGLGQCAAAMVAARRFNRGRGPAVPTVHGCVSNGVEWKFLRLRDAALEIDLTNQLITSPDRILGIVLHAVGLNPLTPASTPAAA